MSVGIVADRYSAALFEIAQESNALERLETQAQSVLDTFKEQPDLVKFVGNPLLTADAKCDLLGKIFGDEVDKSVLHFLYVMIKRNRAHYIREALEAFVDKSQEERGILKATVTVVEPLTAEQEERLLAKLQTITGKTLILKTHIDKSIVGGLVVQMGDMRIDGSVARRLEELQKTLLAGVVK
ncbi:MAG: F0F1 ATP synthase subunit delta [Veillonella sp.]|nr:F0F1 ATP synthase subunit delta [Veillonella sp.]MCF0155752.1 F0F1 ATP synthase subunit delta [Veillonella sp.]